MVPILSAATTAASAARIVNDRIVVVVKGYVFGVYEKLNGVGTKLNRRSYYVWRVNGGLA